MLAGEWRLQYPGTDFSVGGWDPVANPFRLPNPIGFNAAPTIGDVEITTDDTPRPRSDGAAMGADYRSGRTIGFSLSCRGSSEQEGLELAARVATAWRGDAIRQTPGAYAELSTQNGGRARSVFGRPRRYVPNDTSRKQGLVTIECDFQTLDDRFYDVQDSGISVGFVSPPSSGIISPVVTPVTTTPVAVVPGAIRVDGELSTYPVATIWGPITNPIVNVVGVWSLQLSATIPLGVGVSIDTRPWVRAVVSTTGASYAGALSRYSRLDRSELQPGNYAVSLGGIDNTGLSSMQLAWRSAYASL